MTDVHTVAAINDEGATVFLGHFVLGLPCPVCAILAERNLHSTRCSQPRVHARILAEQYRELGLEVRTLRKSYREPPNARLWRKVSFVVRQELGVSR